ncbi:NTP transferase domain-containing protein [Altererythrobacter soli]|uniref:NTP transferase domain-containing protein n=1 Tax=Croceibacterium soli TaxID=1739690 RepID=A0A6I4UV51_9SPHN|nr:NTP transferase domain-containing protein [Croceibacterium soli]MXP41649.1 NTP transferase domain-containing protein [Croceibacterium soli]
MTRSLHVVVLAAQRRGVANPLAERFGVSHKCLIPLKGQPLIAHVLGTLRSHPRVASIAISVEPEAFAAIDDVVRLLPPGLPIECVPAADNLADSVIAAAGDHGGPLVITTADHALLDGRSLDALAVALQSHAAAIAMCPREAVLAAHPQGQRRFYEFRDGGYSNCNLYGLAGRGALEAAEIFRGGGQFAKNAARIVSAFGIVNLLLLRFRIVSLSGGIALISRRMGLSIAPVVLEDGSQAIDVDNDRTYAIVEELLDAPGREALHAEKQSRAVAAGTNRRRRIKQELKVSTESYV